MAPEVRLSGTEATVTLELPAELEVTMTVPAARGTFPLPRGPILLEPAGSKLSPGMTGSTRQ